MMGSLVGFLNHSSLESLLCFDFFKCLECLVGFLFVFVGVFVGIMLFVEPGNRSESRE